MLFQPVTLSDGFSHLDGGVRDRLALGSCTREERVLNIAYRVVRRAHSSCQVRLVDHSARDSVSPRRSALFVSDARFQSGGRDVAVVSLGPAGKFRAA